MVQLLRLRQCTSHPFMLERTIKEAWTLEDVNELKDKFEKLGARGVKPFYEQTKVWVQESEQVRAEARERGEDVSWFLLWGFLGLWRGPGFCFLQGGGLGRNSTCRRLLMG